MRTECKKCGALNTASNRDCFDCGYGLYGKVFASTLEHIASISAMRTAGFVSTEGIRGISTLKLED